MGIVFPWTVIPLFVGRHKSILALEDAMAENKKIFLAAQKDPKSNSPEAGEIYEVGTLSTILQLLRLPDGTVKLLVEGQKRAKLKKFVKSDDYFIVEVEELEETIEQTA